MRTFLSYHVYLYLSLVPVKEFVSSNASLCLHFHLHLRELKQKKNEKNTSVSFVIIIFTGPNGAI